MRTKLSFKESRELAALPADIERLEQEQQELTARMGSPTYHQLGAAQIKADRERLAAIELELEQKFSRWAELEARSGGTGS